MKAGKWCCIFIKILTKQIINNQEYNCIYKNILPLITDGVTKSWNFTYKFGCARSHEGIIALLHTVKHTLYLLGGGAGIINVLYGLHSIR